MLHSMTGFARQSAETELGTLSWELRAVNHRYLDVSFRLPEELRPKEQAFKQLVSAALKRGKVDCALHFQRAAGRQGDMQLDGDLVELIGKRAAEVAAKVENTAPLNPVDVLRWPGVIVESEVDAEPLIAAEVLIHRQQLPVEKLPSPQGLKNTFSLSAFISVSLD